jgi:hypothetical protein
MSNVKLLTYLYLARARVCVGSVSNVSYKYTTDITQRLIS